MYEFSLEAHLEIYYICIIIEPQDNHIKITDDMEALNRKTASAALYKEKVIQFGEGNFLRAFVDWIIWNTNQKTDFNA